MFIVFVIALVASMVAVSHAQLSQAAPALAWNSWNKFACNISESLIKETVDAMVDLGLRDLGYEYVNLDDCWQSNSRDTNGKVVPDPTRFPSGLKSLGDYIHSKGMKFGIYSSSGFKTCQKYPASLGMEETDVASYVDWGVDYLKYDNCFQDHAFPQKRFAPMADALRKAGRPIYFSLCEWGRENPAAWARSIGGNSWRTSIDIRDSWESIISRSEIGASLWRYAGPGGWNDPDMLEVGNGGCSEDEYITHFSMWAVMKAPLIIGNDVRKMKKDDSAYKILSNKEIIAVNQDPLGRQARRVWSDSAVADRHLLAVKCSSGVEGVYEDKPEDQMWTINSNDNTIYNPASGECLVEKGFDTVTTTTDCSKATHWEIGAFGGGSIVSKESGRCLEVAKFNFEAPQIQGKHIQTAVCQSSPRDKEWDLREHQAWTFPNGHMMSMYQRQCLTIDRDAREGVHEVWASDLSDGSTVVLLLNKGLLPTTITLNWSYLNWKDSKVVRVRDLWEHEDELLPKRGEVSAMVKPHGSVVLKLTPM